MSQEWFERIRACRRNDPDMVLARERLRCHDAYEQIKSGQFSDELLVDAGRVYWNPKMEKATLESLLRQVPGFEYGMLHKRCYARWQNGPDLYEFTDYSTSSVLVHALEFWVKIPRKTRESTPRQLTNVEVIVEALAASREPDLRHNFFHAADGFRDGDYFPFVRLFEMYPELAHDCANYWTSRH